MKNRNNSGENNKNRRLMIIKVTSNLNIKNNSKNESKTIKKKRMIFHNKVNAKLRISLSKFI